jgi:hypothetical protein
MDKVTGERRWQSELSSIDTALLLGGVLTVRQCFADDAEIPQLAERLRRRVDFQWMLNGHPSLLSHGWRPENGFIASRWDTYSEGVFLYILGAVAPAKSIPGLPGMPGGVIGIDAGITLLSAENLRSGKIWW